MTPPVVAVLDHGSGNLRSAVRALTRAGATVRLTSDSTVAATADGLVVPGVGAFAHCMAGLTEIGAVDLVREWAAADKPLLGICVGFQLLFEAGHEHGTTTTGLGVLSGQVERLTARRLPHMGWNTVAAGAGARLLTEPEHYYFVHSYGVHAPDGLTRAGRPVVVHTTDHDGDTFVAAVESGRLLATQFHPEKSDDAGLGLLGRWLRTIEAPST
ncbi:imidazole glycerol phosphate synthase subunit HisH [Propionibacteriaceae bacterium Y2011]